MPERKLRQQAGDPGDGGRHALHHDEPDVGHIENRHQDAVQQRKRVDDDVLEGAARQVDDPRDRVIVNFGSLERVEWCGQQAQAA